MAHAFQIRGERFHIPLDSDSEDDAAPPPPVVQQSSGPLFVNDVLERAPSAPKAPEPPKFKHATGFPAHKKRERVSAFKRARNQPAGEPAPTQPGPATQRTEAPTTSAAAEDAATERQRIDEENRRRIADMSAEEIEAERRELFAGLSPALIERLLKRSTIDDEPSSQWEGRGINESGTGEETPPTTSKKVTFQADDTVIPPPEPQQPAIPPTTDPSPADVNPTTNRPKFRDIETAASLTAIQSAPLLNPPAESSKPLPHLDPSSPSFLTDLHKAYFPNSPLPDPATLSWLQPIPSDTTYSPATPSLPFPDLRFAFTGHLLPPATAAQLPAHLGLHHHAAAPDSAGYTLPELARLARSAFPAQRCVAFRALGAVLQRLARGEFGTLDDRDLARADVDPDRDNADEDEESDAVKVLGADGQEYEGVDEARRLARGLWRLVRREGILPILRGEAGREGGHVSARTYAREALEAWEQGIEEGRERRRDAVVREEEGEVRPLKADDHVHGEPSQKE